MNRILKIALIVLALGLIIFYAVWKYVNAPQKDFDKIAPVYSLATQEIWQKYTSDKKLADSLYSNKVIELNGEISRIDKNDTLVSVVFVMAADSMFGDKTINCEMYKKHNAEAIALNKGTKVKIKGLCTGYNDPDIKFNKCSIVK